MLVISSSTRSLRVTFFRVLDDGTIRQTQLQRDIATYRLNQHRDRFSDKYLEIASLLQKLHHYNCGTWVLHTFLLHNFNLTIGHLHQLSCHCLAPASL